jgi:phosphomannomutase
MTMTHHFDPTILREYDIRGTVGETLTERDAWAVGRAFGTVVAGKGGTRVCVGYDGRTSSPGLAAAAERGFVECGLEVINIGLGPTPMMYYAVRSLSLDGGLTVTGSHNPPTHNGFKLMLGEGSFYGDDIRRLGDITGAGSFAEGEGRRSECSILNSYVERLAQDYDGTRELFVAWDAGNGSAGEAMARLVTRLPGRHILLNEKIDGTFPAHHPDPSVIENLRQLQETVRGEGCDLGFAFDGDGDRIGVVDSKGEVLWGDQIMILLARDLLARQPGATVIADVKASQVLFDEIARAGGTPLMWRTGHSLIKAKMSETGAPLAGEMSGHLFFADHYYGYDDALYAAVRFLGVVSRSSCSLAELRQSLPVLENTPELRIPCPEARKFAVVDEVMERQRVRAAGQAGVKINDIDGVRVRIADGWWLLRASNTQAVLVARAESHSREGLIRLKAELAGELRLSGIEPPALAFGAEPSLPGDKLTGR